MSDKEEEADKGDIDAHDDKTHNISVEGDIPNIPRKCIDWLNSLYFLCLCWYVAKKKPNKKNEEKTMKRKP